MAPMARLFWVAAWSQGSWLLLRSEYRDVPSTMKLPANLLNKINTEIVSPIIPRMKRKFYSWEECMNLREVKVSFFCFFFNVLIFDLSKIPSMYFHHIYFQSSNFYIFCPRRLTTRVIDMKRWADYCKTCNFLPWSDWKNFCLLKLKLWLNTLGSDHVTVTECLQPCVHQANLFAWSFYSTWIQKQLTTLTKSIWPLIYTLFSEPALLSLFIPSLLYHCVNVPHSSKSHISPQSLLQVILACCWFWALASIPSPNPIASFSLSLTLVTYREHFSPAESYPVHYLHSMYISTEGAFISPGYNWHV